MESNESHRRKRGRKTDLRFHSFPDDLIIEILYKLPLKVVFMYRTVSKHWNSLISDSCFAHNYCSRRSPPHLTLIRQKMFVEDSVYHDQDPPRYNILHNFHNFSYFYVLPFPKKLLDESKRETKYMVIGSSNGLLLCASESTASWGNTHRRRNYYICNPIPREWIKLPSPIMGFEFRNFAQVGFTTQLHQGFLVVASYKVVILHRIQADLVKFEVFSSETNTWLIYTMNPPRPLQVDDRFGYVSRWVEGYLYNCVETKDGLLHWVDMSSSYNVLISYNPYSDTNSCRLINLPKNQQLRDKESEIFYKRVDAFDGSLRYLEVFSLSGKPGANIGIWTLDDYAAGNWTLDRTLIIQDSDEFACRDEYQILGPCHDSDSMYVWWRHKILNIYKKKKVDNSNETMELRYDRRPFRRKGEEGSEVHYMISGSWNDTLLFSQPIWPTTFNTSSDGRCTCPVRVPRSPPHPNTLPAKIKIKIKATADGLRSPPHPDTRPRKIKFKINPT